MDPTRLEATDIFYFIGRFEDHETHTIDACHYLVRYWSQSSKRVGMQLPMVEEGSLTLTDFCQLVLPQDNTILRATASQRVTHPAEAIHISVERMLSKLLKAECDFQETMERMKAELEGLKGYSIKKLFGKLDKQGRGFIDVNSIRDFM